MQDESAGLFPEASKKHSSFSKDSEKEYRRWVIYGSQSLFPQAFTRYQRSNVDTESYGSQGLFPSSSKSFW